MKYHKSFDILIFIGKCLKSVFYLCTNTFSQPSLKVLKFFKSYPNLMKRRDLWLRPQRGKFFGTNKDDCVLRHSTKVQPARHLMKPTFFEDT